MPLKTWNTQADWEAQYRVRIRDRSHPLFGQWVTYGRVMAQRMTGPYDDNLTEYNQRRDKLIALFGIQPADRILIAGCGFGFLIEAFKDAGYTNCWGIDNSAYISSKRGTEARGDVLFVEDTMTGGGRVRTALRNLTGANTFDWVISEYVLESYADSELDALLNAAESVLAAGKPLSNIIHILEVLDANYQQDPSYNLKTLAQWNAVRPSHSWVDGRLWVAL